MMDVEPQIAESFDRLYPVPLVPADWDDVLDRARVGRTARIGLFAPRTIRRRVGLVVGLAVVLGGVLLAAGTLGKSPGVLERARAALDPSGRILHVVDRWGDGPGAVRGEAWQLPDGSLDHVVYRPASGALGADCVISDTRTRCWNPALDVIDVYQHVPPEPGYPRGEYLRYGTDWPASLRRALGSGYARLLGQTTFDGRAVFAVLLAVSGRDGSPEFKDGVSDTLYVDRETYLPVAEHMPAGDLTRHFDSFEFLPDTASNREAVELPAPADTTVIVHPVGEYPPEGK